MAQMVQKSLLLEFDESILLLIIPMQRLDVLPVLKSQQTCHSMEHDDKGQQEPLCPFQALRRLITSYLQYLR